MQENLIKTVKEDQDFIYIETEGYLWIYHKRTEDLIRIPVEGSGSYDARIVGGHLVVAFKSKWRTEVIVKRLGKVVTIDTKVPERPRPQEPPRKETSSVSAKSINRKVLRFLIDNRGKVLPRSVLFKELDSRGFSHRGVGSLVKTGYLKPVAGGYQVKNFSVEKSQSLYRSTPQDKGEGGR